MVFDCHVHVSGAPLHSKKLLKYNKKKLKNSIRKNDIKNFFGLVSEAALFDNPNELLNVCSEKIYSIIKILSNRLGDSPKSLEYIKMFNGEPVVNTIPDRYINDRDIDLLCKGMNNNNVKFLKLYTPVGYDAGFLIKKTINFGINKFMIHTSKYCVDKLLKNIHSIYKNDAELILYHGCIDSTDLIKCVNDYGVFVDTSIHPIELIMQYIYTGCEDLLVFGSDWPCSNEETGSLDWNAQVRELSKIGELDKSLKDKLLNKNILKFIGSD